jgi:hypothetical protein
LGLLPAEPDLARRNCASHGAKTTMNGTGRRWLGYCAGVLGLVAIGWILTGQAARPSQQGQPMDWSHRHVIFSQPSTDAQAAAVIHNPRYWQQFNREHFVRTLNVGQVELNSSVFATGAGSRGDWSQNLGSGANAGIGVFPAKYSFSVTTANCGSATRPDTVVFSTGLAGSATQATIVAFDNLYSGCTGIVPQVYWAYNTGGRILTSPIHSEDGTQVAFVQTSSPPGQGQLILLKWAASSTESVGSPKTLVAVAPSSYRGCSAPCMTSIALQGGGGDTTSSVFPDYPHDTIWVGAALGSLHKFSGVFHGTPAEVTNGVFPKQLNGTNFAALSSPVYDASSGNVFVGDVLGFLYRVSSTGASIASGQLDFGTGIVSGPVVDSTSGKVYVFASSDGTTNCGSAPCAAVYQLPTNFTAGATGTKVVVGASLAFPSTPSAMYVGGFDSSYFGSGTATGNLYVCGNTGGPPKLYRIPINAGTMGAAVAGPVLAGASTGCSPVTDVPNPNATGGAKEWIFAGVQASGLGNSCGGVTGGCAMNFVNTPWQPSHAYTVGQQVLDTNFNVQTCRRLGTSKTGTPPTWTVTVGGSTSDGTVRWVNQGPHVAAHPGRLANHAYAAGAAILDTNGNVEVTANGGTSRNGAAPTWPTTINTTVADGSVTWRMVGLPATASLAAAGGTGGIIVDNIVGTLAGASQIYFSTQSNQVCGTTGAGGCAVQASQSALQ